MRKLRYCRTREETPLEMSVFRNSGERLRVVGMGVLPTLLEFPQGGPQTSLRIVLQVHKKTSGVTKIGGRAPVDRPRDGI